MLSVKASQLIEQYLNLPFPNTKGVRCPYYINKKNPKQAEIRALIGKGRPEEIVEEAKIISIKYRYDLFDFNGNFKIKNISEEEKNNLIRDFLIKNNLGIDCSGFATHILKEHFLEKNNINILKKINISFNKNFLRRLICKLRPIENLSVEVFAHHLNSQLIIDQDEPVDITKIQPGDFMIMLKTGPNQSYNHIVLIEGVEKNIIKYISSRACIHKKESIHGVARGEIEITNPEKNLLNQTWKELGKINNENETYLEAIEAQIFQIKRLKI